MAVYDLEEQEQISEIKAWWAQHGSKVTAVVVIAALVSVGWQGWQWFQNRNAAEAGAMYFAVEQAADRQDAQKARDGAGQLIGQHAGTTYAQLGALVSAGVQFDKAELDNARAQLEWAATSGNDPLLRDLARLRLAAVLLQKGEHDAALARLEAVPADAYKARFADLRGDVLAAKGSTAEARVAYKAALDALGVADPQSGVVREVVRVKLESLEG